MNQAELQAVFQSVGQPSQGFVPRDLGDLNHKNWKSREDEVLGWSAYLQELSSWAAQGSVKSGREIEQSSRWLAT